MIGVQDNKHDNPVVVLPEHGMSRSRLLSTPRFFLFSAGDTGPTYGIRLGFKHITDNETKDDCLGQSHYFLDIIEKCNRQVVFTFSNRGPDTCSITELYFHDGNVFSIYVQNVYDADGPKDPACSKLTKPGNYQSAHKPYHDSGTCRIVKGYPNDADAMQDGIKSNESLGIVFDLQSGITLADVIAALSKGEFNISIKLQGGMYGARVIFINESRLSFSPTLHQQASSSTKSG